MQLRQVITLVTLIIALVLPFKAKAMSADAWVNHWTIAKQEHIHAKRWVKHHPGRYTYKSWKHLLKYHNEAILFASNQITRWRYKMKPPHYSDWLCIHRGEGSWWDSGDPYWGGLQMDKSFMRHYAPAFLLRRGWANRWSPMEQMWVAERAHSSRGFYPWPNTARNCGLL